MKRYYVVSRNKLGEIANTFSTDSPRTALNKWFTYSSKYPSMSFISCGSVSDCKEIYKVFLKYRGTYYEKYWLSSRGFYLSYQYIERGCLDYLSLKKRISFNGNNTFYDSVPLFSMG